MSRNRLKFSPSLFGNDIAAESFSQTKLNRIFQEFVENVHLVIIIGPFFIFFLLHNLSPSMPLMTLN